MLPSPALYFTFLAVCAVILAIASFRADRLLGWIVVFALVVNLGGAGLMGWWVQRMHGREYSGGDEVSYQWDGQQLLTMWRTGDTSYVRSTVGIFAPINAVVIAIAGPGYTPMRLATGLVGAIGVSAAFWLALLLYRGVATARIAALLCATSPLLILFAWGDLRERWISTAVLLTLIAAVLTIQRPAWRRVLGLMASLWLLTELRHYWGTVLGYLVIAGSPLFGAARWPRRIANAAVVTVAVGIALWVATGTVLGIGIRHETVRKYVAVPQTASPSAPAPLTAEAAPAPRAPIAPRAASRPSPGQPARPPAADPSLASPDAANAKPPVPSSGPTLGEPQLATRPANVATVLHNLSFVLFGRVRARPDGGQFAAWFLLPEALWSFLLIPLAVAGVVVAIRRGDLAVLIPAGYVGAIMALFTWLHGEEWTTYRLRNLYWPVLLILVAGGISWTYEWWRAHRRTSDSLTAQTPDPAHT
jgi:hypothetical protein